MPDRYRADHPSLDLGSSAAAGNREEFYLTWETPRETGGHR